MLNKTAHGWEKGKHAVPENDNDLKKWGDYGNMRWESEVARA